MAYISILISWLGATAWLGAEQVGTIISGDGTAVKRFAAIQEYSAARHTAGRYLRCISGSGMGAIIAGNLGVVIARGRIAPPQAVVTVIAALALLGLVFHVEQYLTGRVWQIPRKACSLLPFCICAMSVVICSQPLVLPAASIITTVIHWVLILTCGALIGIICASSTIIPFLKALPSPEREHILADIGGRWTLSMGSNAALLAIAGTAVAGQIGGSNRLLVTSIAIGLTLPFIAIIGLRVSINLRLDAALADLPLLGIPDRNLRARTRREQAAAHGVWRQGIAGALITAVTVGFILANTIIPPGAPKGQMNVPTLAATATLTPTITPAAAQANLGLTQTDHGVTVSLTSGPLSIGKNTLHLTVANAQGQPIPNASVTLVVNSMLVNAGGVTLTASPDPTSNPGGFSATVTLTQPDTWQIVVLVATTDQSIRASVIFAVNVAAKAQT